MKITLVSSSMRKESQSNKIGSTIKEVLDDRSLDSVHLDLVNYHLPFFNADIENYKQIELVWKQISDHLANSDAFVFITPEWNGMASPLLKNFFMYVDKELAHKPALLVSVSSSATNGAYPIAELRSSSFKNNHVVFIPHHVIVRNVNAVCNFDTPDKENKDDIFIHEKINHSLDELINYAYYLSKMRSEKLFDLEKFPYGM